MTSETFTMRSRDGLELFCRIWRPEQRPLGLLCICHGLGEHSGRYGDLAASMNERGWAVIAFDLRGHGRSGGRRGHISSYEALMDDIGLFLAEAGRRMPGIPPFLFGQSMGGNLVINYALRRESSIAGAVAFSPMLRTAFRPPRWKTLVGKYLRRVVPLLPLGNEVRAEDLSRDPEVARAYRSDPLVHGRLTLRFYDVLIAGEWALRHAPELAVPMLIMHGDSDRVTSHEASAEFAARAGSLCTLEIWNDANHEIHNEPDGERALIRLSDWMREIAVESGH